MNFTVSGPGGRLRIVLALVVGLATVGYGVYSYTAQTSALDSAETVEATVVSTAVEEVSKRRGTAYSPRASFEFTYEGERYTASNVYPGPMSRDFGTREEARAVLEPFEEGATVTAHVPPDAPGTAFLVASSSRKPLLIAGLGSLVVLGGLLSTVRRLRRV